MLRRSREAMSRRHDRGRRRPVVEALDGRCLLSAGEWGPGWVFEGFRPPSEPSSERLPLAASNRSPNGSRQTIQNLIYTPPGRSARRLDLYLPTGEAPVGGWPVVMAIHGGGWRRFSKDAYGAKVAGELVRYGFAVVAPNYRLSSPTASSWPGNRDDLYDALRWIRSNARRFGLDAGRIAAMGESAGGHLAALLGTDPADPATRIGAVVSFYGPTDLNALRSDSPSASSAVTQMLGRDRAGDPRLLEAASPVAHVSADDPPMLLIHGEKDWLVPGSQAIRLANALTAAGVSSQLVLIPGAGHGFGFSVGGRQLLPEILSFLRGSLHIQGRS